MRLSCYFPIQIVCHIWPKTLSNTLFATVRSAFRPTITSDKAKRSYVLHMDHSLILNPLRKNVSLSCAY